jgi:hypothetical protein
MNDTPRWAELRRYSRFFDADLDRATLEEAGVPVLLKGALTGAFGPGFAGWSPGAIRLFVPAQALEEANAILTGEVGDVDGEDPDDAA